ncbi:MAG: hypothetical protein IPF99_32110 [Deltaproteobacteria bacterium]|nr:hypothetical protein [Deltaproteobacteria bacterium]
MLRRGLGSCAALWVLLAGCTETVVRCREGYVADDGMEGRTRCVLRGADAGVDAGSDAGADAMVPMDTCNPAAADPPGDGQDSNCDGVDGVAAESIFVAEGGSDSNTGLTPDQPVRTVTRALAIARGGARRSILIGVGTYDALPIALGDGGSGAMVPTHQLVDGVTLSGRYPGGVGGWVARSPDESQRSMLRGQVVAAIIQDLRTSVSFHHVDLTSERNPMLGSLSCYGLVAVGTGALSFDRGRVRACSGSSAGAAPPPGPMGGAGSEGQSAASGGGGGGGGCPGGNGGRGGTDAMRDGATGSAGTATDLGPAAMGGLGGTMALPIGGTGAQGATGATGRTVAMGAVTEEGYVIPSPEDGQQGGTGGGGGGGFASGPTAPGGGGGGGGCGGIGGEGGTHGGASVGLFAWGEAIRVSVTNATVETLGGGNGGAGGSGGAGGMGGVGGAGSGVGAAGGPGGPGGRGGEGGPGSGGPSLGLVVRAGTMVDATGVTWTLGSGGMSGSPLGPRGRQEQIFRVMP